MVQLRELPDTWSVDGLLALLATASPPYHALIDTGALVTGYSNLEVAAALLDGGLPAFDGVVFLDAEDRQMLLLRSGRKVVPLAQAGVPVHRRFTFYDQVHTTGMDIKQAASARAALTLGKDMSFRDYAQGAYRMRGIGKGQTVELLVPPAVLGLVHASCALGAAKSRQERADEARGLPSELARRRPLRDVAAWLHVNSMRSEKMQA